MFTRFSLFLALLIAGTNAQCPPLFEFIGGRCLAFFTDVDETFADSSQTCSYFGGKLAKIDDCHLLSEVAIYMSENGIQGRFWIDGTDVLEEGTFIWSDGTPVPIGAPFWDSSSGGGTYEPQEDDGDDCIAMAPYDGFYFHNENCSSTFQPLCHQTDVPEDGTCTLPFIDVAGGCFYFMEELSLTFAEARLACNNIRGDLAIIDECDEMAPIINFVSLISPFSYVWIGGRRESSTWFWIDGSPVKMQEPFWGRDQVAGLEPNGGNCIYMSSSFKYRFLDGSCTDTNAPMCEAPVATSSPPLTTPPITTPPETTAISGGSETRVQI